MPNELWLGDWTVHKHVQGLDEVRFHAGYGVDATHCPSCGVVGRLYRHGTKRTTYRDAPAYGKPVVIDVDVVRYRCRECGTTSLQPLPDMEPGRRMTRRLADYIRTQGVVKPYARVAADVGLDEKTVRTICDGFFAEAMAARRPYAPTILGIDELTLGGRKRTVFVDVAGKTLIDIIEGMHAKRVNAWLARLRDRERIRLVTIDMWGPYKNSIQALLPDALIVVDKWHVLSKANFYLDRVRNRDRHARGERSNPHKGRLILQTRGSKLSEHRRAFLDAELANRPLVGDAWRTKEGFYDVFDQADRASAEAAFDAWKAGIPSSVRREFGALAATVDRWREEIFTFFDHPFTNAYTEARNRLVKDLNRAGRGYSFDSIRAKALLSPRLTGEPMIVCESCLGLMPRPEVLETHIVARHPETREPLNLMRICANCHRRFHMEGAARHGVSST